jgi:hypothetical protein
VWREESLCAASCVRLKLQPAKGPVPVLVIDSAEKPGED